MQQFHVDAKPRSSGSHGARVEPLEERRLFAFSAVDPTFGPAGDGVALGGVPVTTVAMAADGAVVRLTDRGVLELTRYSRNGQLDQSFGENGTVTFEPYATRPYFLFDATAMVVQADGKVIVGGTEKDGVGGPDQSAMLRFHTDGTLDNSFGGDGKVSRPYPDEDDYCYSLTLQPDGRILAAGSRFGGIDGGRQNFVVHRYLPDGTLDRTFGTADISGGRTGSIAIDIFGADDSVQHIALQPDGAILLGGGARLPDGITGFYTIVRLTSSGKLDRTFGKTGRIYSELAGARDMTLATDGSILLGYRRPDSMQVTRLDANTGAVLSEASVLVPNGSRVIDLAVTSGQKVVAVTDDGENWVQARFTLGNDSVDFDTSFGSDGTQITDFGPNYTFDPCANVFVPPGSTFSCSRPYEVSDNAQAAFVQPGGAVIIAGTAATPDGGAFAMVRFVDSGTVAGSVFRDPDGLGSRSPTAVGTRGFRVFVDRDNDGICDKNELQARTSSTGRYTLTDLPPGTYWVRVTPVEGWRATTNLAYKVVVPIGGSVTRHFGVTRDVLISGTVFMDANKDGGKDAAEAGLSAWQVFVDADGDGILDEDETSVLTDAAGRYAIGTLPGGTHRIRVVQQDGYRRTSPAAGYRTIALLPGAIAAKANFGEKRMS